VDTVIVEEGESLRIRIKGEMVSRLHMLVTTAQSETKECVGLRDMIHGALMRGIIELEREWGAPKS
jgi:hypothetical protein